MTNLLNASCRVAFAALIHDIGKFAERAKIEISPDTKERNQQVFCPHDNYRFTRVHAAYTGIAIDKIEKYIPKINNVDTFPFQMDEKDDSIIGAAARHHKPETYLQHIISTADRLSSAFERSQYEQYNLSPETENYCSARLIPLFEKLYEPEEKTDFRYRYPLASRSWNAVFPSDKKDISPAEAVKEYADLWKAFTEDIQKANPTDNWDLWLDGFDTLYSVYTRHIPSASYKTIPDVSLYDHSKSTAALATALWRYHYETGTEDTAALKQDEENKILLIQGDVSGIQNFIFEAGKNTRKSAYKILRGRSFFVSLITECAALKILRALQLPSTSQIMNAAGKFMIVAPDTVDTRENLDRVKKELDEWLLRRFFGRLAIGVAALEACQKDFENKQFGLLQEKISRSLGQAKLRQFDLCANDTAGVCEDFFAQYDNDKGICCFDGRMPAEERVSASESADYACKMCLDILAIGENLASKDTISICETPVENGLTTDIFGFYIGWKKTKNSVRSWDIGLPSTGDTLFNGLARRYINAYVPRFSPEDTDNPLYDICRLEKAEVGKIKTFSHLAAENCRLSTEEADKISVKPAIICLKGDIDNLGKMFQIGIKTPTFATVAQLSRQINEFFAVWLPGFQSTDSVGRNIYTVFAGGDDFYLIGPWLDIMKFVPLLKEKFAEYMCNRADITFSVGMCMTGSGDDAVNMSAMVEKALEKAKNRRNEQGEIVKNGVCCFERTVSFADFAKLTEEVSRLDELKEKYGLSIGYMYGLLALCEQAQRAKEGAFADALWRSKLVYRTARLFERLPTNEEENKQQMINAVAGRLGEAMEKYGADYKIALFTWLYQQREEQK